jgi:thymidylate kinase
VAGRIQIRQYPPMPVLIVVAGPIGAGKSTVANLLCQRLAERRLATAAVDLDEVAFMQRAVVDDSHEFWRRAAVATAALVRAWFDVGTDVVVAHGPFFESCGYDSLLNVQSDEVVVRHVLLRVSVEVALERVRDDPERGLSRDAKFLKATHIRFREIQNSLPEPDFQFDTTTESAEDITQHVAAAV